MGVGKHRGKGSDWGFLARHRAIAMRGTPSRSLRAVNTIASETSTRPSLLRPPLECLAFFLRGYYRGGKLDGSPARVFPP